MDVEALREGITDGAQVEDGSVRDMAWRDNGGRALDLTSTVRLRGKSEAPELTLKSGKLGAAVAVAIWFLMPLGPPALAVW